MRSDRRPQNLVVFVLILTGGCSSPGLRSGLQFPATASGPTSSAVVQVSGAYHGDMTDRAELAQTDEDRSQIHLASRRSGQPDNSSQAKLTRAMPYLASPDVVRPGDSDDTPLVETGSGLMAADDWLEIIAPEGHGRSFAAPMSPDAQPGSNVLIIRNLPKGTKVASVWVSEWINGRSVANRALFETTSVQLFDNGTKCRVVFRHNWNTPLPAGASVILD